MPSFSLVLKVAVDKWWITQMNVSNVNVLESRNWLLIMLIKRNVIVCECSEVYSLQYECFHSHTSSTAKTSHPCCFTFTASVSSWMGYKILTLTKQFSEIQSILPHLPSPSALQAFSLSKSPVVNWRPWVKELLF